ncbi:MAG: HslU--HslV peptidase ATPase subunit, partial [Acidaminococcus sp.]|nr:HslU--HslV peptidase ATPase subunit [Acidaminococcus sp.]
MPKATEIAEEKIANVLLPLRKKASNADGKSDAELKAEILQELKVGNLDNVMVDVELPQQPKALQIAPGQEGINIGDIFGGMFPQQKKKRKLTVKQALDIIKNLEAEKMIDSDSINSEAIARAEQHGVVFIDEIDKVAGKNGGNGPDVSREGVQRDILPIVEGCTVQTKYGSIRTDFILFIAAGAFHVSRMQDLIPELQGRFPIRVELDNLSEEDFVKILTEPDNAVLKQYKELLNVDGVELNFTDEAIKEIAKAAFLENETSENLGARRLHSVLESLLQEILYEADDNVKKKIEIDEKYVLEHLSKTLKGSNLKKYIL